MKILFAAGGTAGHINPALAVAGYIRERHPEAEINFVGTPGGMESRLVPAAGYSFYPLDVEGFQRKISAENVKRNASAFVKMFTSSHEAVKILRELEPDICIGTGGYVSGPLLGRAEQMHIKTAIHEQNAFPGITTKLLAPRADAVMLAVDDAEKYLPQDREYIVTGNPVRQSVIDAKKEPSRRKLGLDGRPVILSFGGSLGAKRINEVMSDVIAWHWKSGKYQHIHATGKFGIEWMPDLLRSKGVDLEHAENIRVSEYIDNMDECMAAADLVICRSGAIALSELQVQGKASILIPSPNVAENHQYHNAMAVANRGGALVIEEKNVTGEIMIEKIQSLLEDRAGLEAMGKAAQSAAVFDANERIYQTVMGLLK